MGVTVFALVGWLELQDSWAPRRWLVSGLVGTKKVVSFRTRGHTKSGEFEKENSTFLFFLNV